MMTRPRLATAATLVAALAWATTPGPATADPHDHAAHNHAAHNDAAHNHAAHNHAAHDDAANDDAGPAHAAVGAEAPDFTLTDTEGNEHTLSEYVKEGKTVVLEWFNPDCPFVKKHHQKFSTMKDTRAAHEDVVWLAINSGAPGKQGHGLSRNAKSRGDYGITYPVLLDEAGVVGRMYAAKTTPHMFVIHEGTLVYAGAIDDNRSPSKLGETNYVSGVLGNLASGEGVANSETKSYGCSVKYSAVNAVP